MAVKTLTRSFASGEISPELFGRVDLTKNQTGLKTCRNFEILPHGPAANRTGFEYVLETKDSTKRSVLIPFIYNTTQAYQLEFGDLYVRFHTQNGTVLEANQNITGITQPAGVVTIAAHGYSNGQWLFLNGIGGMTQLNGRFVVVSDAAANTFRMKDFAGNYITTGTYGAYTAGGTAARVYEIVSPYAVGDFFDSNGVLQLHITQSNDVLTIVHPSYQARELRRSGATSWAFNTITVTPTQAAPTAPVATPSAAGAINYTYAVTALADTTLEESVQTADATCANDLTIAGRTNLIQWTNAAGAVRYNIYKKINGLYGYIGQGSDGATGFVDNNIVPNIAITPPIANDPFTAANERPGAVGYFQGRRWFAGSNNKPLNLWATRSGTESNMGYSIPTQANDSITVRLTSRQNNAIRHIVPLSDLILLTSGGEWRVSSDTGAVTPINISYRPEDYIGASNMAPLVTSSAILYGQDRGGRVREMKFLWSQQGYRSADVSIMAPHLFDSYVLTTSAFVRAINPTAWFTRSDGTLLGLTYVPEHEVAAWHHHDTDGTFESVVATPEGSEDVLYAIVKRNINGRDVRYVERKRTRNFGTLPYAFFVDSGLTYNGPPATSISGLWHLEGETVSILADGAVQTRQVVTNGTITVSPAASVINIGLPFTSDLETLPLAIESQPAAGQGDMKNVNKVHLRVNNSSGVFVGPSFDKLAEAKQRTTEPYGSPPSLISDVLSVVINPAWNMNGGVCVRQTNPLPVTVLSMTLETALGG